jgi:hypothetical protein
VLDSVFAGPQYDWAEPSRPLAWLERIWNDLIDWLSQLQQTNPAAFQALLWGLVIILGAIVAHAVWTIVRTIRGATRASTPAPETPAAGHDADWYRAERDRLVTLGRYSEAMQADFTALMLELDGLRALRYGPGRTPFEYTLDPSLSAGARARLRELVAVLYRFRFAGAAAGPEDFASWRHAAAVERYAPAP